MMLGERSVIEGTGEKDLEAVLNTLRLPVRPVVGFYRLRQNLKIRELHLVVSKTGDWTLVVMQRHIFRRLCAKLAQVVPEVRVMTVQEWTKKNCPPS